MIFCEFHPNKIKKGYLKHIILKFRLMLLGKNSIVKNWF